MSASHIIVGLEIGTSKVCVAVGEVGENQVVNIIGLGQAKSRGVRKGEIIDVALAEEDVRNAIVEAEQVADVEDGLTSKNHPCQVMGDVLTFEELRGPITNKKIAWLGDGNNICYSLIEAATQFNFQLAIACPKKLEPVKKILKWAKKKKASILITKDPKEAVERADAIMTDKWISMNDSANKKKKEKLLKPYQVNKKIMKLAKSEAIFMHCLPASRQKEVTNEVMDGKQSAVWLEALNRMHVQKSIIQWCLKSI